ncbi:hypothetical protein SAMN05216571_106142 [Onishia taeanensis]|uniref:Uncharacterized protein n=1 Tax=Onishia taeanensis TaxID=284577 RepID=A0A1G7SG68_9GAMM|nr:hypothetical protein [Halomonas taeanensis]SDG21894.1 hypothetical protein SAMN05216571_106142 [Halomonas taeanensis]
MSNAATQLATTPPPQVVQDRAGFGALRAELHARVADQDLAELWAELVPGERRTLLASAQLDTREVRTGIESMPKPDRDAIRAAIRRMSQYANRLRDRLEGGGPHQSQELAAHARQALEDGNTRAAMHWLAIIERGVA